MKSSSQTKPSLNSSLERKIRIARWILLAEKIWLRLWILFLIVSLFLALSYSNIWIHLDPLAHKIVLGLFGLLTFLWLILAARVSWPTREQGIERLETTSKVAHRPASSYEDTVQRTSPDSQTDIIWKAHKKRMETLIEKLRSGRPSPRTYLYDPCALRTWVVFIIIVGSAWYGKAGLALIREALHFEKTSSILNQRLDAWITPPPYTGRPPIILFDGSRRSSDQVELTRDTLPGTSPLEIPEKSILVVRASGQKNDQLTMQISLENTDQAVQKLTSTPDLSSSKDISEIRYEIMQNADIRILAGKSEFVSWKFRVIPDTVPGIALTKNPERTSRGAIKLTYFVQDDYGVSSAEVTFSRVQEDSNSLNSDPWSEPEKPDKGPRPPYSLPPKLGLRLPGINTKQGEAFTYHEIGSHPWAGQRVKMVLIATDVAGKIGRSPATEILLPERTFNKPLARSLIELRKLLIKDPRYAEHVGKALQALTFEPEGFIDDIRVYFPLRATIHRLKNDHTRVGIDSVIDQLWYSALRVEEGDLSDAEKNLRDIQERLAKALEQGASDEEINNLMRELKDAIKEYARKMEDENSRQSRSNSSQDDQQITTDELDQMMNEMEDMAKNGLRDQAKDLLAEMRDLMERMELGKQNAERQRQNNEMKDAIKKLGEAVGQQEDIMDDTFEENRQKQTQTGGQMRRSQQGQKGQRGQSMQTDRNELSNGQGNNEGEMGFRERGVDGEEENTSGSQERLRKLAERQAALREKINEMRKNLQEKALIDHQKLEEASEAMRQAEEALRGEDLSQANSEQSRALDQMRESGREMAEQLEKNSQQGYGQNGEKSRDPLGRPQRFQGSDQGRSVKVPDQIDIQQAREVLEELRRRAGDLNRPKLELDYIERLLRWY